MCVCVCVCVCCQHFFVNLIKQYRHFLPKYFCIHPFKLPYQCYDIRRELFNKPSIVNWFLVLSVPSWAIISGVYIEKAI